MAIQQINALPAYAAMWVRLFAAFTLLLGSMALCAWIFDIDTFKRILPGLVSIKANTAVSFLLSGAVLYLQTFQVIAVPVLWLICLVIALIQLFRTFLVLWREISGHDFSKKHEKDSEERYAYLNQSYQERYLGLVSGMIG